MSGGKASTGVWRKGTEKTVYDGSGAIMRVLV